MNDLALAELCLDLTTLQAAYAAGRVTPVDVVREALRRSRLHADRHAWITLREEGALVAEAESLLARGPAGLPLYGVPFAVKDNIDLAGVPTTAGCAAFAYTPAESATVVQRLVDAGAIAIGKTNLDQFATGLNGTRTADGVEPCRNSFDPAYISGGSSSGSAVATALGMVSFALGTDTAGSGRVPACFNNLVGLKPSRGLLSAQGVVPACRTLDCVSVFALTASDAAAVFEVAAAPDPGDPYSRALPPAPRALPAAPRIAVPRDEDLTFCGDAAYAAAFAEAVETCRRLGAVIERVDISAFLAAARLLYEGPWVAERYAALKPLVVDNPGAIHPVVRAIVEPALQRTAVECFEAHYKLAAVRQQADALLARFDALLIPTAPTTYTVEAMLADPVRLNSNLGTYTNFVNLLDQSAIAVPTGFLPSGLPFGVTLCAPAFADRQLLTLAQRLGEHLRLPLGAARWPYEAGTVPAEGVNEIALIACGAHMSGLPLNPQLLALGARLELRTTTAPKYRLHALTAFKPPRPGLVKQATGGHAIEVEVWRLPVTQLGAFFRLIPAPLALGRVELADGRTECGFLCEPHAVLDAPDISAYGGWRAWLASLT